jgi:hypothetical protein
MLRPKWTGAAAPLHASNDAGKLIRSAARVRLRLAECVMPITLLADAQQKAMIEPSL